MTKAMRGNSTFCNLSKITSTYSLAKKSLRSLWKQGVNVCGRKYGLKSDSRWLSIKRKQTWFKYFTLLLLLLLLLLNRFFWGELNKVVYYVIIIITIIIIIIIIIITQVL